MSYLCMESHLKLRLQSFKPFGYFSTKFFLGKRLQCSSDENTLIVLVRCVRIVADSVQYRYSLYNSTVQASSRLSTYRYSIHNSTVHANRRLSTVQVFITQPQSTCQQPTQYGTGILYRTGQYMPVADSEQYRYSLQNSIVQVFITEQYSTRQQETQYSTDIYYTTVQYMPVADSVR